MDNPSVRSPRPEWIDKLEIELNMSTMRHAFTFSRDEVLDLLGVGMQQYAKMYETHKRVTELEKVQETCAALAASNKSDPWAHDPSAAHVCDMVSMHIATQIRSLKF